MRTPFICGNWKMNKTITEASSLVKELKTKLAGVTEVEVGVCPPAIALPVTADLLKDSEIKMGAQNLHWAENGAFTGELAGPMLQEAGAEYVIIGHSERREYFGETDMTVNKKGESRLCSSIKTYYLCG